MFFAPALSEGLRRVRTTQIRRDGQGLRAGPIVERFDDDVITGYHNSCFSLQGDLLVKRIETGVSAVDFSGGVADVS